MERRLGIVVLALLSIMVTSSQEATGATVSSYDFTPKSGGPGTVVHITGVELYYTEPINIYLVQGIETAGPGGMIATFQMISKVGVTQPDPAGGSPTATVVIPGRLPNGSPIPTHTLLGFMLTDKNNNPIPEVQIKTFEFVATPLPKAGEQMTISWLLVAFSGAILIAGLFARRKATTL